MSTDSRHLQSDPAYGDLRPIRGKAGAGQHATRLARSLHAGRITASLREAIIDGELPAGTPLVEVRLAERWQISRGPVRNALVVLEGEGLVETLPNGRTMSAGFDTSDLDDLIAARLELESAGIRQGVARDAPIEPILAATRAIEAEGASTAGLVELDIDFHRALVAYSGSRFLVQSWLAMAPVIQAVIGISNRRFAAVDPLAHYERIVRAHSRITDAVAARDPQAAAQQLEEHFALTTSMFTGAVTAPATNEGGDGHGI